MVDVFRHDAAIHAELSALLQAPTLYDEFLRHLARRGLPVPARCVERDWTQPYTRDPDLVPVFKTIYDDPERWWDAYEMAEKLVDVEESFQLWRFRHMKTVERTIGHKTGTGGSSGVGYLRRAVDHAFFPELIDVRTAHRPGARNRDGAAIADVRFGRGARTRTSDRRRRARARRAAFFPRAGRAARTHLPRQPFARPTARCDRRRCTRRARRVVCPSG